MAKKHGNSFGQVIPFLAGMMTCRLSGNSLLFYPEIINANRNNWLGFSSLREIMIPSFEVAIPYNTI